MPQHGIGRPCKVGKEQIIGLLTALELFVAEGDAARHRRWHTLAEAVADGLRGLPGCQIALEGIDSIEEVPAVALSMPKGGKVSALDLVIALQNGSPSIQADPILCDRGVVTFSPTCLQPGEPELIAAAVQRLIAEPGT